MEYQCHFDPYNRVFTHISERVINPRKPGEFLPVMFATPDPLPELGENQTARRKDDDSGWELIEDFRGAVRSEERRVGKECRSWWSRAL